MTYSHQFGGMRSTYGERQFRSDIRREMSRAIYRGDSTMVNILLGIIVTTLIATIALGEVSQIGR